MPWPDLLNCRERLPANPDLAEGYAALLEHLGPVSTLLERDDHFPPFEDLLSELDKARSLGATALARRTLCA